jgi:putative SOS response-associated peptidase YedK
MCGRYVLKAGIEELKGKYFATPRGTFEWRANYNAAPSTDMPVVLHHENEGRVIDKYRWGLVPFWAKEVNTGYSMFNARAESIASKRTYQKPFKTQRCIVPANGFYEWVKTPEGKIPYYIMRKDQGLISFAGLYEHWKGAGDQVVNSFTIITTDSNDKLAPIHDRMPAILLQQEIDLWLDPANQDTVGLRDLIRPYPSDDIAFYKVSTAVNNARNQGASLIEPEGD